MGQLEIKQIDCN